MRKLGNNEARHSRRWRVVSIAAALLGAAVLFQPDLADAAPHGGGGGFHGGGGFGGFHGGGFGGFHGGGFHGGFVGLHNGFGAGHGTHWHQGWRNGQYGWWWDDGLGSTYYPYPYDWGYPDYGYYDYSQPYAAQTWYYCSNPAGYYPYVTQCNTAWQPVPAS
jgi:hypothetical protein